MKKIIQIVLILSLLAISSCRLPRNRDYVVKSGNHFANIGIPTLLIKNTIQFTFTPTQRGYGKHPKKTDGAR